MKLSLEFKAALLILGALTLALAAWIWWHYTFHRVPVMVPTASSREAQQNEFLAAFRILEKLGYRPHDFPGLNLGELPAGGTLIIPSSRGHFGTKMNEALSAWVDAGGHLVVVPTIKEELEEDFFVDQGQGDQDEKLFADGTPRLADPLLEELGVAVAEVRRDKAISTLAGLLRRDKTTTLAVELPGQPALARIGPPMRVELDFYADLPLWYVWGDKNLLAVRVPKGEGAVTVLGGMRFLRNRHIGAADNAVLLWELVRWNSRHGDVWLVTQLTPPGLGALLVEYGWTVLVSLACLIMVFVWQKAPRFGPRTPDPEPVRRSLMEHITASGLFLWRHGGAGALVRACQMALRNRGRWRTPGWQRLSEKEKRRRIAGLAKVDEKRVDQVLSVKSPTGPLQFVETVQQLERIRKRL